jgi:hypothetical protein
MPLIQPQKTGKGHLATAPTSPPVSILVTTAACAFTAIAALFSQGAVAPGDYGAARLAFLPLTPAAFAVVLFAAVLVFGL